MKSLRLVSLLAVIFPCPAPALDSVVVFNELQYHPPAGQAEWIEMHNVMSVNVDLSEWRLSGGVEFMFPAGTVIPAGGFVVVKGGTGAAPAGATGPFSGALDNKSETIRLRNVSGRIMDEISYADDGRWPVGPDGSGATLARRSPVSPGGEPESWTVSQQLGGTPGAVNFPSGPPIGPTTTLVATGDTWLYNQTGPALASNWAETGYTAGAGGWLSGPGVFAWENATLPAATGTVLTDPGTSGVAVHYFQKSFTFTGNPASTLLTANLLLDDGAVVYLNGHEIARRNIAEGTVDANTRAQTAVGTAAFTGPLTLPADHLVNGTNVLSVSVHQPAAPQPYVVLTGGLVLAEELGALDSVNDLALASKGSIAFAKDLLGNGSFAPTHTIPNLNNGTFGNGSSWIGDSNNSFCGINLGATAKTLRSIAFGRDNTGSFADRTLGLYTLQYTTVPNPTAATPDGNWTTIGTLNYQSAGGGANFAAPSRRHRFNFNAVSATGIRLTCPGNGIGTGACVDEIELYEQAGTVIVPQPLTLTPAAGSTLTWDGNNGLNSGVNVPSNLARAADGAVPFASGELGPSLGLSYHLVANINDGKYTNPFSWIGAGAANQYAAVRFGGLVTVSKVAWGRDNSNTYNDRSLGTYTIQITTVASPGTGTPETGNAATGWKTVGTAVYNFSDPTFTHNLRHEFAIAEGGSPIPATGLRVKVSDSGICIDELEAYGLEQPDVVFGMSLTAAELLPTPDDFGLFLNEIGGTSDPVWRVELFYFGTGFGFNLKHFALNGHLLPDIELSADSTITLDETMLGFRPQAGDSLFLTYNGVCGGGIEPQSGCPDPVILLDTAVAKSTVRARNPLNRGSWLVPTAATFGSNNTVSLHTEVAINEIFYHAPPFPSTPTTPVTNNPVEWIELKNRTASPVDLSGWRLDGEVSFTFPPATMLPANGFLVIAGAGGTPPPGSLGPFSGSLSNSGGFLQLEDASGNPADEVRYTDTGWSDSGGSSLELRDARADNTRTTSGAWQDSDESGKSAWQTFTYRMTTSQAFGPTTWNELRLGMLDAGECLVDDVSIVRDPDGARVQVVQNGAFTSGAANWRFLGNHRTSAVIPEPGNPANNVLKIIASGPAETNHNHIESTFAGNTALTDNALYEVSFRARWLAGTNQLNVKAYYSKLAKTVELPIPPNAGTPGAENSRAVANTGPLLTSLRHEPPVPAAGQNAVVSVTAVDPDNVASATLFYKTNLAAAFTSTPMTLAAGTWTATIPAQSAGAVVQFYVQALDGAAAAATAPAGGANSRALIQWADAQSSTLPAHELRLIMLDSDRDFLLANLNRLSNERQPGTLVYRASEVFYDAGVRLQGTAAGRVRDGEAYPGYDISFPPDHLFRGVHENIGIDRSGRAPTVRGQDEIYVKHTFHRAGVPCTTDDLCYFIAPAGVHTGTAILGMAGYGGEFVSSQFDEDGTVFNFDVTYDPTMATGGPEGPKPPVPFIHVATDFPNFGADKEQYRGPFDIRAGRRNDNYAALIPFCQAMALPMAQLPAQAAPKLDLDATLRCTALVNLWSIGDTYYTGGFQHNLRLFVPDSGTGITFLPWDNDFVSLNGSNAPLYPSTTTNALGRLIGSSPAIRRRYLGHMHHFCQTVFQSSALNSVQNPWLAHYGSTVGQSMTGAAGFVDARRAYVLGQMPATATFAITTNGGSDFTVASHSTLLQGTGWINVSELRVAETGLLPAVQWTSETAWRFTMPLLPGANAITLEALSYGGAVLSTDVITVTNSLTAPDPRDFLRLTELHYHPANPSAAAEIAVSTADADFEFIELQNTAPVPLDVSGVHFTAGVDFTFPPSTSLAAGQYAVLVKNAAAFQARYGGVPVAGTFAPDSLNNGGETLTLTDATGREIFSFAWDDAWFPHSDGPGWSMVPVNPADAASLAAATAWGLSFQVHGNPGAANGAITGTEFDGWRHQHFTAAELDDPSVSGSGADPEKEGVPHLLRYALGLTPQSAALPFLPSATITPGGLLRIDFRRLKRAVDIGYIVETSADLGAWIALTETPVVLHDNGDGTETVRVETPATAARKFVRLRVQTQP